MNKKILSIILAIPALVVGVNQKFSDSGSINTLDKNPNMLTQKPALVKHYTSQALPFILAARDGKEEECHWLGTCKDND